MQNCKMQFILCKEKEKNDGIFEDHAIKWQTKYAKYLRERVRNARDSMARCCHVPHKYATVNLMNGHSQINVHTNTSYSLNK